MYLSSGMGRDRTGLEYDARHAGANDIYLLQALAITGNYRIQFRLCFTAVSR